MANDAGRRTSATGIAPPDSSHPKFHNCAGAIDYQIEADFSGPHCAGLPNTAIRLGEKFGRLMNYGDGMYAGQFMGGMYAEAFFEKDIEKVIEAGLKCIPPQSLYAGMVRDVLRWHRENADWEATWEQIDKKYRSKEYYIERPGREAGGRFVLMGLLYGNGDPDKTIVIACGAGRTRTATHQPGGVFGTTLGQAGLPERFLASSTRSDLQPHGLQLPGPDRRLRETGPASRGPGGRAHRARRERRGGLCDPGAGAEAEAFEDLRKPGPTAESRFTDEEKAQIKGR